MREKKLTHMDDEGNIQMVDVGRKSPTIREATAHASVQLKEETFQALKEGRMKKGDALTAARIAGILAAKRTAELIPLCHPICLTSVDVKVQLNQESFSVEIEACCRTKAETGVEMEALTAASVSALTIYDMCKSIERGISIHDLCLVSKSGGKSGTFQGK